jgi:hypothetical protein
MAKLATARQGGGTRFAGRRRRSRAARRLFDRDCQMTEAARCPSGLRDCDADRECQSGVVCTTGISGHFGISGAFQVCAPAHCSNGVLDLAGGETGIDCGGLCGRCPGAPPGCSGTGGGALAALLTAEQIRQRHFGGGTGASSGGGTGGTLRPCRCRQSSWRAPPSPSPSIGSAHCAATEKTSTSNVALGDYYVSAILRKSCMGSRADPRRLEQCSIRIALHHRCDVRVLRILTEGYTNGEIRRVPT